MPLIDGIETAMPAPAGYVVDFANPTRKDLVAGYYGPIIGMVLMALFLAQFLYMRWYIQRSFKDLAVYFVLTCWILTMTSTSMILYAFQQGLLGIHAWETPLTKFNEFYSIATGFSVLLNVTVCFGKLALLLFYYPLSFERWWKWCVYGMAAIVIGYSVSLTVVSILTGIDRSINWVVEYMFMGIFSVATDLVLLVMPLSLVFRVQMSWVRRAALIIIFTFGILTVVTGGGRLYYVSSLDSMDYTWIKVEPILWCVAETQLLVICPSIATLSSFVRLTAPRLLGESYGSTGSSDRKHKDRGRRAHQRGASSHIVTFGSGGRDRAHKKVDEFGMTVNDESNDVELGPVRSTETACERSTRYHRAGSLTTDEAGLVDAVNHTWDPRAGDDGEPERAIVQTRTVMATETIASTSAEDTRE